MAERGPAIRLLEKVDCQFHGRRSAGEGSTKKIRWRRFDEEGPSEKVCERRSVEEGPRDKVRRRRSTGEDPSDKVPRRSSIEESPSKKVSEKVLQRRSVRADGEGMLENRDVTRRGLEESGQKNG